MGVDVGGEFAQQLQGTAIGFGAITASDVEVEPIAVRPGEKVAATGEALPVEEFILPEPVHGLDVAVVGVGGRGDEGVAHPVGLDGGLASVGAAMLVLAPDVFGAVVGLEAHLLERDAAGG